MRKKGLNLDFGLRDELKVMGDEEGLRLCFTHLVDNAVKFSDNGTISILGNKKDSRVSIRIKDEGIGIDEKEIVKIKQPFYQVEKGLDKRYGGLGIGLSIAELVVKAHGGSIEITSEKGRGTTVNITLPGI